MFEVELKAHVEPKIRKKVIEALNSRAVYGGHSDKSDVYYHIRSDNEKGYLSVRIRKEDGKCYATFKEKCLVKNGDGTSMEVNTEKEAEFSDESFLKALFEKLGAEISLTKTKITEHWNYSKDGMNAHIELCTIEPIGDFLEIEILTEEKNDALIEKARGIEMSILEWCGIDSSKIEGRFYSELLKHAR